MYTSGTLGTKLAQSGVIYFNEGRYFDEFKGPNFPPLQALALLTCDFAHLTASLQ